MVITNVILPVFFIIFLGFLLGRLGKLDVKAISRVQLYALSPALIFVAMARAEAGTAMILRVLLYVALMEAVILILVQGIGFLMRRDREERNAMSLASVFMNAGFYGIPVCLLAFGELGLVYATTFVVAASIIQSTVGIYIASAGRRRPTEALAHVFKVPLVYALVLGRVLASLDALPPEPFMKMIGLLGQAAIPVGLILLGLQLERIVRRPVERPAAEQPGGLGGTAGIRRDIAGALISAVLRILGGFTVALMLIRLFDFEPVLRNVIIVESAMPTAVNVVVYATEFGCRPKLVALGILFATVASILSITLILNYLT
ncbi:MAG: AEC family transporter [bacterium]|nr:MAG: AEC family transporter [bacterium]